MSSSSRNPTVRTLIKAICDVLPNFASRGRLVYETPVGSILKAFYLNPSSNKGHPYYECFVLPLYILEEDLVLSYGDRIQVERKIEELHRPVSIERMITALVVAYETRLKPIRSEVDFMEFLLRRGFKNNYLYAVAVLFTFLKLGCPTVFKNIVAEAVQVIERYHANAFMNERHAQTSTILASDYFSPGLFDEMLAENERAMRVRLRLVDA